MTRRAKKLTARAGAEQLRAAAERIREAQPGIGYAAMMIELGPILVTILDSHQPAALRSAGILPPPDRVKIARTVRGRRVTRIVSPKRAAAIVKNARKTARRSAKRTK